MTTIPAARPRVARPSEPASELDTAISPENAWERRVYRSRSRQRPVAGALSDDERARLIKSQAKVAKLERRIAREFAAGNVREAKRLARTLYQSKAMRAVAAAKARKTTKFPNGKPSLTEIEAQIEAGVTEPAKVIAVEKASGGFRPIVAFGAPDKARQIAVGRSYGAAVTFHPHQFGVLGKGMFQATSHIRNLIKTGRYTHAIELDISNFFGSISPEHLSVNWGIPEDIIHNIITLRGKENRTGITPGNRNASLNWHTIMTHNARGLPQGSASSPLLAYGLLAPMIEEFERQYREEVVLVNWCDNFLLLGPSRKAIQEAVMTLTRLLAEHPAGPFALRPRTDMRPLSRGIDFIGHRFVSQPCKPIVRASADKLRSFKRGLKDRIREITHPSGTIVADTSLKISYAAIFALRHLSKFRCAPQDHINLCWFVAKTLKRYQANRDVARLMRHIDRRVPHDSEQKNNRLPVPAATARAIIRATHGNCMISHILSTIPRNFRADRVVTDPALRDARIALVKRVVAEMYGTATINPPETRETEP